METLAWAILALVAVALLVFVLDNTPAGGGSVVEDRIGPTLLALVLVLAVALALVVVI